MQEIPNCDVRIRNNQFECLQEMKENMHIPTRATCKFEALMEVFERALVDVKQENGESVIDCTKCFKQVHDILKFTGRENVIDEFSWNTKQCENKTK